MVKGTKYHENAAKAAITAAVSAYCDAAGLDLSAEPEAVVMEMLIDLRHHCDAHGIDFGEQDGRSYSRYAKEVSAGRRVDVEAGAFACGECGSLLRTADLEKVEEIPGNEHVKRAMEVAAAGRHSLGILVERGNMRYAHPLGRWAVEHGASSAIVTTTCPCGGYQSDHTICRCSKDEILQYWQSEPYENATAADIVVRAPVIGAMALRAYLIGRRGEGGDAVAARVAAAQEVDREAIDEGDETSRKLIEAAVRQDVVPADRAPIVRAVALTIAALGEHGRVEAAHTAEALQYQHGRPKLGG